MNSFVAAQIKVLREQRGLSQQELAELVGTQQAGISRLENTNYSAWKVQTLAKLARAFDVRLRISFEEFGTLPEELSNFGRESLKRCEYTHDDVFNEKDDSDGMQELSEKEREALSPPPTDRNNVVEMEKKANATNFDTARESSGVPGMARPIAEKKSPSGDDSAKARGEMSISNLPKGA
jgi:transcriptional regulator with XRE-family HTH domain